MLVSEGVTEAAQYSREKNGDGVGGGGSDGNRERMSS